jgi:HD-GYP domain-containing protein (c-di-GMP phosphodiesterase class II)
MNNKDNDQMPVYVLLNNNKLFQQKVKKIRNIQPIFIKNINEVKKEKFIAIIIDNKLFYKYIKTICSLNKISIMRIFLVTTKEDINDLIISELSDLDSYALIYDIFPVKKIQTIINNYLVEIKSFYEKEQSIERNRKQTANFNALTHIGISLSVIRDIDQLLDMILSKSREITNADAGSIYLVEENLIRQEEEKRITTKVLRFAHSKNFSFPTKFLTFITPITKDSIVGYSALTGKTLNIPDAHQIPGSKNYHYSIENEKKFKVHNRSIIVVPMKNQKDEIIGVIQLFNKKIDFKSRINDPDEFDRQVIPFNHEDEEIVESLASQAAVSLENNILYKEIKNIFDGFIKASVVAIESRDPTTSGHSERVAKLTKELARKLNNENEGIYKNIFFKDEELAVIEYAGLLHDFGKIGVREKVLVKEKKLYPEELEILKNRYKYMKSTIQNDYLKKKLDIISEKGKVYFQKIEIELDAEMNSKLREIDDLLNIILKANEPTILNDDSGKIIKDLVAKNYYSRDGEKIDFLKADERDSLITLKGSLTEKQRKEIESHVTHSFNFLCNIPWTKDMANIPHIVYKHHEKLNGKGYPRGIKKDKIPIQARMMTISDIYDALTAQDRPYKKSVTTDKALNILKMDADDGLIDQNLLMIFIQQKVYRMINTGK